MKSNCYKVAVLVAISVLLCCALMIGTATVAVALDDGINSRFEKSVNTDGCYGAANAPIYYTNDIKIIEEKIASDDNHIKNGDFETGDATDWETWQYTAISANAAHDGTYGAHLKGNGNWGALLNQSFAVESGKTYELSFWVKVNHNGVNVQCKGVQSRTVYAIAWLSFGEWTRFTTTFTVEDDSEITLNFLGADNDIAEDAYVDSMICAVCDNNIYGYGDANGDGEITALDVILLQRLLAGYDVALNEAAADANGDGEITALDVILLQRYLAGYKVTLGPR